MSIIFMGGGNMIEIKNLSKVYPGGLTALENITLSVESGEFVSIIGRSGSGKSTLMNIIGCLDKQSGGSYRIENIEISELSSQERAKLRNKMIGFVFQGFNLSPRLSAFENIELPLIFRSVPVSARRILVREALERVGLSDRAHHFPGQLSGGQQQRVAIARAIASKPSIILADEPTGSLDKASAGECMNLLRDLNDQGHTLILITHDTDFTEGSDNIYTLNEGHLYDHKRKIG